MAIRAGLPESYDFGGERVTWLSIAATHWMGDAGFLRRLKMKLHGFCFVGDTVWIRGSVVAKRIDEGQHVVDIDLAAINHRSEFHRQWDRDNRVTCAWRVDGTSLELK